MSSSNLVIILVIIWDSWPTSLRFQRAWSKDKRHEKGYLLSFRNIVIYVIICYQHLLLFDETFINAAVLEYPAVAMTLTRSQSVSATNRPSCSPSTAAVEFRRRWWVAAVGRKCCSSVVHQCPSPDAASDLNTRSFQVTDIRGFRTQ